MMPGTQPTKVSKIFTSNAELRPEVMNTATGGKTIAKTNRNKFIRFL